MLVEKEVIRPGTYWYTDEDGAPKMLKVTPELTKYWHEQGNKMLGYGLTVPVPYEHDFSVHPMTPKDKLLNNAGEVKEYKLKDGDTLYGVVDVQDPDVKRKIGHSIRWTSPWINSFTDGDGREWKNVISHLALTTRPRVTKQAPFESVAAALSMATPTKYSVDTDLVKRTTTVTLPSAKDGFCLSRAGRVVRGKKSGKLRPRYPMAFSLWGGGISLAGKGAAVAADPGQAGGADDDSVDSADANDDDNYDDTDMDMSGLMDPTKDSNGDVKMEELLCDLLQALGVPMPDESNEGEFKRHLYEAAMSKIKELTSKGMGDGGAFKPDQNQPPSQQPNASQPNPLIQQVQQEQQPMYMSLEEINKLPDPMRGVALAMYQENEKLRAEMEANKKVAEGLRSAKLREADAQRATRVQLLTKLSPRAKGELDAMLANPAMALSMDDKGGIVDPLAQTLAVLEKGLADLPWLLTHDAAMATSQAQPTDADMLTAEQSDSIASTLAGMMGCPPEKRAG